MKRVLKAQIYTIFLWSLILIALSFYMLGCASSGSSIPSTSPKFELTLSGTLDGGEFTGIGMGDAKRKHLITISSRDDINYFIAQSCHRFEKREDVIDQDWFPNTKTWSYQFTEAPTLEDTGDCPLRICEYSKTVGAPPVQCAVIDFQNPKYSLPAENICNGSDATNHGKSLCHTKVGLIERIRFAEAVGVADPLSAAEGADPKVKYLIKDQCEGHFIDEESRIWQYVMPENECYVIFYQLAKPHALAKLTVIPFNTPLYKGN